MEEFCGVGKIEIRNEALQSPIQLAKPLGLQCRMRLAVCITRQICGASASHNVLSPRTVRLHRFVLHSRNEQEFSQSFQVF